MLLFVFSKVNCQTQTPSPYGAIINANNYRALDITNVILGSEINQSGTSGDGKYNYYNNLSSATTEINGTLTGTLQFTKQVTYEVTHAKIWIDFDRDDVFDFSGSSTEEFSIVASNNSTDLVISQAFSLAIPAGASAGTTRMRIIVYNNGNSTAVTPYNFNYRLGDSMDFNVNIVDSNTAPTAVCQNLSIDLDSNGDATITPSQINNGSTDTEDGTNLTYSLDKTTFNCDDVGANTVTLTVTDSGGLTDTCTATVTVSAYSGVFTAPVLETINAYCSYTATAPVYNYQCNTQITGTTNNPTSFNSDGSYNILWAFNNGSETVYANQTINISTPVTPTNVSISNISSSSATVSWNYATNETFRVRYRKNGTSNTWVEQTTTSKNITLSNLNDGTEYEVQVKLDVNCDSYTASETFTTSSLAYCIPTKLNANETNGVTYYIANVSIEDIDNTTGSTSNTNRYTFYDNQSATLSVDQEYTLSLTFNKPTYNAAQEVIWIDFDNDGVFDDSEKILDTTTSGTAFSVVTKSVNFTVPSGAVITDVRMRVVIGRSNITSCMTSTGVTGEMEDYIINIQPAPTPPTAVCVGNLNVDLDISGNATITPSQINNGSYDDYDDANDLILSLDKTTFTCDDLGDNTVTLTVTDTNGLTDTCTATVNVNTYSGAFEAPTLETINAYCSYSATAPVMNYLCGTEITGTTANPTVFNSPGSYNILWSFDNGGTVVNANQTINITDPSEPTNITFTNITRTKATVSWSSVDAGPFLIRYRVNGTGSWTETTSETTSITLTDLYNGTEYEVQISTDADVSCLDYSNSEVFETNITYYCSEDVNLRNNASYYISEVNINSYTNTSVSNGNYYNYTSGITTTVTAGETFSGSVTYQRGTNSTTTFVIWVDYDNDGLFDDSTELVYSNTTSGSSTTTITETFNNITVPSSASTGKTRMRFAMLVDAGSNPSSACDYNNSVGEVEDYDVLIDPVDISDYESAMITQVYHTNDEKWIEVTNNGSETIPTSTLILAIYKDTSGSQSGITPTNTYVINSALTAGESVLIKSSGASLSNVTGTTLSDNTVTDFDGGDDIIAIVSEVGTTAWENRFDVISTIANNSSYVRNDEVSTYNNTYTASEWTVFDSNLLTEVTGADSDANAKLGVHNFGSTNRTSGTWSNGTPDRSRFVVIDENYQENSNALKARSLSITGSNKLTITNQELLVINEVEINTNAELRLAGTSQLIQTHTGSKQITGSGKLYIDQNSTIASKYRFNYFSSPVNTGNTNNFTVANVLKDGSTATSSSSTPLDINFVSGYDGSNTSPISIADHWIYTFPSGLNNQSGYVQKKSTGTISNTDGFLLKGPGVAQNYTFVGVPNDGDITTSIGGDESYLVGNPYPSAISVETFIEDNEDAISGTLYFWQHAGEKNATGTVGHNYAGYIGGYATRNKTMGLAADQVSSNNNEDNGTPSLGNGTYDEPKPYIAVGQGFFIQGDSDGGTVNFNNSQREYVTEGSESIFFKTADKAGYLTTNAKTTMATVSKTTESANKTPIIKLGVDYINDEENTLHRQLGISFISGNTFGYENGYDSPSYNEGETNIYWKFPNDEEKYAIAGVQEISEGLEVPIEIVMGYDGELKISIDEWQSIDRDVYLKDKEAKTITKINGNKAVLNLNQNTYSDRFYLTFDDSGILATDDLGIESISVSYDEVSKTIDIRNAENTEIYNVELYNVFGQQVQSWNEVKYSLQVDSVTYGVYIIKVITNKGEVKKKVLIK